MMNMKLYLWTGDSYKKFSIGKDIDMNIANRNVDYQSSNSEYVDITTKIFDYKHPDKYKETTVNIRLGDLKYAIDIIEQNNIRKNK